MNWTVLPADVAAAAPQHGLLVGSAAVDVNAANDHSGSVDAAMTRTFTPSQSGAFFGSLSVDGGRRPAGGASGRAAAALSGPVTESNGLRARMASALVDVEPRAAGRGVGGRRAGGEAGASCFSSSAEAAPTSCVIACALRNAATATSARMHRPEVAS